MRKVQFANNYYYHVYNRGVDKREIFLDQNDYLRFYKSLFLFNDANYFAMSGKNVESVQGLALSNRQPLVNIASFCLMPNHYHFLLEQICDNGITSFMHSLSTSYTQYFNLKNDRTGRLFEGPFKAVLVKRDAQLEHLPRYIHLNPLDLTDVNWREGKGEDWAKAEKLLEEYPWSSHNVYLGKPQQLPVVEKSVIGQIFNTPEKYKIFLKQWGGREIAGLSPFEDRA
ncbi:hypothetical protein A3B21_03010 [Candidatus Uhrbacteria bacterium RIFCSPLOWO2_01_FULL_47_24]|uniref:Transposase IS200-like domain-containing protein n=1 Tax=Candidatus Uhrbacteria bacterium RIFCSPLOWO2_01_FULL_47_24 TaxID=1802401 RepID=A0A1F7URJ1_9BACT|nr:MAG: hypothetical protein A2753_04935 [Candidatus Uhrbacteria bacterium RIFCSPHIGHO2_01_FULL_47_11]OGL67556.1 MAG: hypothetical protein A3D58_03610 [Candidatus Uhrbacteria bacterium RIFCSPHIGHO2_02_FULL_46_47]OGL80910.1 MAG: hypothetical protein A3B21_03010 [Candidatus Uhrbacteria bacterium RIFCSPLOWO2_01_FULL_47_24]OGL84245.1 MAG: hypothetical protein A3J03_03010 [Candidatus Uhrbacteria bacterium RIFCSPLOWO2_02_FULL_46_25]OGL92161.1 MAG: hypothetical protein A3H11_04200 [Candidatus Uhrbacte